jgi:5-methylcytosine-specific restriction enzyme A
MGVMRNRVHRQPFLGRSPRAQAEEWKKVNAKREATVMPLYHSQAWRELRLDVLREAGYRCVTPRCANPATIADHKVSHRGDAALFFDRQNLQAMCKPCHDLKTWRVDRKNRRRAHAAAGMSTGGV